MPVPVATRIRELLREVVLRLRRQYLVRVWQMDIGEGTAISGSAKLDKTNPRGVHIGNKLDRDVHIGDNCFIGAHSIVLPGVTIGNGCIVAAASVVARDVPAGSLVAGNPARVVEHNLKTTRYGVRISSAV
jgi:acetyltransferase-like isoleucine patch superfamily enzyme